MDESNVIDMEAWLLSHMDEEDTLDYLRETNNRDLIKLITRITSLIEEINERLDVVENKHRYFKKLRKVINLKGDISWITILAVYVQIKLRNLIKG